LKLDSSSAGGDDCDIELGLYGGGVDTGFFDELQDVIDWYKKMTGDDDPGGGKSSLRVEVEGGDSVSGCCVSEKKLVFYFLEKKIKEVTLEPAHCDYPPDHVEYGTDDNCFLYEFRAKTGCDGGYTRNNLSLEEYNTPNPDGSLPDVDAPRGYMSRTKLFALGPTEEESEQNKLRIVSSLAVAKSGIGLDATFADLKLVCDGGLKLSLKPDNEPTPLPFPTVSCDGDGGSGGENGGGDSGGGSGGSGS